MAHNMYRQGCEDLHRRLAAELKDYCWMEPVDCVVVERNQLEARFGISRIKKCRLTWFREDVSPWFPHFIHTIESGGGDKVNSCYLSRLPFPTGTMTGVLSNQSRALRLCEAGLKTTVWSPE